MKYKIKLTNFRQNYGDLFRMEDWCEKSIESNNWVISWDRDNGCVLKCRYEKDLTMFILKWVK
jgi:hypothetical protein